jgi:hypothetical protein
MQLTIMQSATLLSSQPATSHEDSIVLAHSASPTGFAKDDLKSLTRASEK